MRLHIKLHKLRFWVGSFSKQILGVSILLLSVFFLRAEAAEGLCVDFVKQLALRHSELTGQRTGLAVAVILLKDGKVLMGKRKSSQTWGLPGGTYEECDGQFEVCGAREVLEETGIKIKNFRIGTLVQDFIDERQKYYFTVIAIAEVDSGEASVLEPEKATAWQWFEWTKLPKPLFAPNEKLVLEGFDPFK